MTRRTLSLLLVFGLLLVAGGVYAVSAATPFKRISNLHAKGLLILNAGETVENTTDDFIKFQGRAGADDTDLQIDLDGTHPVLNSATDSTIEIAESLSVTGSAVTLPADSLDQDDIAIVSDAVIFCGDLANAGTTYLGPAVARHDGTGGDYSMSSANCNGLDNTTEATADNPISSPGYKLLGFMCTMDAAATDTVTFTFRDDAGDTTPASSCTIAAAGTTCVSTTGTTTDVVTGSAIAMKAVSAADESGRDAWCRAMIAYN